MKKQITRIALLSGSIIGLMLGAGCDEMGYEEPAESPSGTDTTTPPPAETTPPAAPPETEGEILTLVGTLRQSSVEEAGGEHTGWMLVGTTQGDIEIDVSAVAANASTLDGTNVVVTGRVEEKSYAERGPTPVLVAESIERAG